MVSVNPQTVKFVLLCFNITFGWHEPQFWYLISVSFSEIGDGSERQISSHVRHVHPKPQSVYRRLIVKT